MPAEHKAGRMLDALIHDRYFAEPGRPAILPDGSLSDGWLDVHGPNHGTEYSRKIADAWRLIPRLRAGRRITLSYGRCWTCTIIEWGKQRHSTAPTAPLALCRAALPKRAS